MESIMSTVEVAMSLLLLDISSYVLRNQMSAQSSHIFQKVFTVDAHQNICIR